MGEDSASDERLYQIGEVADAVGLSLRTIRHYEELGVVVPSARSTGGFRLYTDTDIERLRSVRRMKPLDFTLDEIREILELTDQLDDPELGPEARHRLSVFASLANERCERLRLRLALASEFTTSLNRAVQRATPARPR